MGRIKGGYRRAPHGSGGPVPFGAKFTIELTRPRKRITIFPERGEICTNRAIAETKYHNFCQCFGEMGEQEKIERGLSKFMFVSLWADTHEIRSMPLVLLERKPIKHTSKRR